MRRAVLVLVLSWVTAACGAPKPPPSADLTLAAPAPLASESAPRPAAPAMAGAFEAAPCSTRAYRRSIALEPDGTFAATDLVSPCPPGARCVWSGVILWGGTWRRDGDRIVLAPDAAGRLPERVPASLVIAGATLREPEDPSCVYHRAR